MMQNLIIFALGIVAIQATGEFTILSTPKSLLFKGNEAIQSHGIGEFLFACLGNSVSGDNPWSGLNILDPFQFPKEAFFISINGVERSKISATGKTYPLQGNTVEQSLNGVVTLLEEKNQSVCVINFEQFEVGKQSFRNIFGDVKIPSNAKTNYLDSNLHTSDKVFLESIAHLNAIADNLPNLKTSCKLFYVGITLDDVAKSHGKNSEAITEGLDLASTAVKNLNKASQKSSNNEALVVIAVNKPDGNSRSKRDVAPKDAQDLFNLAEYYSEDYPVIFNIILWFMVVFGFALLAICYAIGSMDPGRDSIIYRMTSTRMKKDN